MKDFLYLIFLYRHAVDSRMNLRYRVSRGQSSSPVSSSSSNSGGGGGGGGGGGNNSTRTHHRRTPLSPASPRTLTPTHLLKSPVRAPRAHRAVKRSSNDALNFEVRERLSTVVVKKEG